MTTIISTDSSSPLLPRNDDQGVIAVLEDQVLQLADHETWLDAQIRELEFAIEQETTTSIPSSIPASQDVTNTRRELETNIDKLKQEYAQALSLESVRNKVIDNAHSYQVVLESLFKSKCDLNDRGLLDQIDERDRLVSEFLKIHQELQGVQRELSPIQTEVLDCQNENRNLVRAVEEATATLRDSSITKDTEKSRLSEKRTEEELKALSVKYNVISNVLQGLLLESGIDWADDPHYLNVMLKLRRPLD